MSENIIIKEHGDGAKRYEQQDDLRQEQLGAPREIDYARPTGLQYNRKRKSSVDKRNWMGGGR